MRVSLVACVINVSDVYKRPVNHLPSQFLGFLRARFGPAQPLGNRCKESNEPTEVTGPQERPPTTETASPPKKAFSGPPVLGSTSTPRLCEAKAKESQLGKKTPRHQTREIDQKR